MVPGSAVCPTCGASAWTNVPPAPPEAPGTALVPVAPAGALTTRSRPSSRRGIGILIAALGVGLILVAILTASSGGQGNGSDGSGAGRASPGETAREALLRHYLAATAGYNTIVGSAQAAIASSAADMPKQVQRIHSDGTTNALGALAVGCNGQAGCLAQARQQAANSLADQRAALAAKQADAKQQATSVKQIVGAAGSLAQQLRKLAWTAASQPAATALISTLAAESTAYGQAANNLASGQVVAPDDPALTAATTNVTTAFANLAAALGLSTGSGS
jgi:hypothetical protein